MALALILTSCRAPAPAATPTIAQADPNAVFTAAAATAQARMTQNAATTPTATTAPSQTPAPTTPAVTVTTAPITPTVATTQQATTGAPAAGGGANRMEFVADLTVPDGTNFKANETFVKTWRVKNSGTSTWSTAYVLAFSSGAQLDAPDTVPLPSQVAPGQTVDISVNMTAPEDPGNYIGFWVMRDAGGTNFGIGPNADQPIYVDINVGSGTSGTNTPVPTTGPGTPTVTPQSSSDDSGDVVSDVSLTVDNPAATSCPHTFRFTGSFDLSKAASVTYQLEAGADDAGFEITLPAPVTANLQAGTHSVDYTLDFSAAVNGWARLRVTSPTGVVSNQVVYSLSCQ